MAYALRNFRSSFDAAGNDRVEYDVVMQFARILRLQANMLEQDGDVIAAKALRERAARSVRAMVGC